MPRKNRRIHEENLRIKSPIIESSINTSNLITGSEIIRPASLLDDDKRKPDKSDSVERLP